MFNKHTKTFQYGAHTVTLETGEIARQASAAVKVSMGDTVVLVTVVAAKDIKAGQDFFPLTVDYLEKSYAAGKIPGGFFKREGKPSEKEILTSRLIDRPIRPLFPEGFYHELTALTKLSGSLKNGICPKTTNFPKFFHCCLAYQVLQAWFHLVLWAVLLFQAAYLMVFQAAFQVAFCLNRPSFVPRH